MKDLSVWKIMSEQEGGKELVQIEEDSIRVLWRIFKRQSFNAL